ncbi:MULTISPECIES: Txe/YoeB family addiction module toxin [Caproicibacterium]|uniref:Endoribonuclease YoeB n=1 Tax=Caproicibacterium argilliputei TaxID=3030016 RepID=A0AA97DA54_9FIRM|nr:Txe/YoeB family addiction module toxin [Caproicibacterium argilliputei]WOC33064.1 Txe/YoeB family addiction module toxin [Caproicibacterium argilliputei]
MYKVILAKQAVKDFEKLKAAHLLPKAKALVEILAQNPYQNPPPYEKLVGNLKGIYSRRINIQHRLIYNVLEEQKTVHILRMWTHYE